MKYTKELFPGYIHKHVHVYINNCVSCSFIFFVCFNLFCGYCQRLQTVIPFTVTKYLVPLSTFDAAEETADFLQAAGPRGTVLRSN